jgi:hypothetical protein
MGVHKSLCCSLSQLKFLANGPCCNNELYFFSLGWSSRFSRFCLSGGRRFGFSLGWSSRFSRFRLSGGRRLGWCWSCGGGAGSQDHRSDHQHAQ